MRDTRLVFVEGFPGSGKTTTASWLASRLQSARLPAQLVPETQPGHPLNVGGDHFPAGDTVGAAFFERYTPARFVEESLEKGQAFVSAALRSDIISVLDSYPFQNSARVLVQLDATTACIQDYAGQVEALTMPLHPVLIYLGQRDVARTVQQMEDAGRQRGKAWTDYIAQMVMHSPHALARHLAGFAAVAALLSDYAQMTDLLLRQSSLPRLVLDDSPADWPARYQRIEAYLGLVAGAA